MLTTASKLQRSFMPADDKPLALGRLYLSMSHIERDVPFDISIFRIRRETGTQLRISANVTADFGNVTGLAGQALRGVDFMVLRQFWSSSGSRLLDLGDAFRSDSPVSVIR
jgi:hypothetical protein